MENSIFAGLMGLLTGMSGFFHSGTPAIHNTAKAVISQQASISGSPRFHWNEKKDKEDRRFFGKVTVVDGSTLTVAMQGMMWSRNISITPTITPPAPKTWKVVLDSNTKYTGGSQSDISVNTIIAGEGKISSDGVITAVRVDINPVMPSGMQKREFGHGMRRGGFNK